MKTSTKKHLGQSIEMTILFVGMAAAVVLFTASRLNLG